MSNGSTTPPRQYRKHWCFTINNPEADPDALCQQAQEWNDFRYLVFQLEQGPEGTPHYQGYVEFSKQKLFTAVKKLLPTAHLEGRRGTRTQARDYCRKEDSRQDGPWEVGVFKTDESGRRTDIEAACETLRTSGSIRATAEAHPTVFVKYSSGLYRYAFYMGQERREPPRVILLYGEPGVGKTRHVVDKYPRDVLYIHEPGSSWYDGYDGEKVFLLDDFAGKASGMRLDYLLRLLDRYPMRLPVKGGHTNLRARKIYLTTNIHPLLWYSWKDRETQYSALKRRFSRVYIWVRGHRKIASSDFWDGPGWVAPQMVPGETIVAE